MKEGDGGEGRGGGEGIEVGMRGNEGRGMGMSE